MIILNKDKLQKNEYLFLDDEGKLGSIKKGKVILTKNLWIEKKEFLKKKKNKHWNST